jgi:hypothetical protein
MQIFFRFACILVDSWYYEVWGMFSHVKHLVETSVKVTGSSSGGFNNLPPPQRSFSISIEERELQQSVSSFVDKHKRYRYTAILNNEVLKGHFAYTAHQDLNLSLKKPLGINS